MSEYDSLIVVREVSEEEEEEVKIKWQDSDTRLLPNEC